MNLIIRNLGLIFIRTHARPTFCNYRDRKCCNSFPLHGGVFTYSGGIVADSALRVTIVDIAGVGHPMTISYLTTCAPSTFAVSVSPSSSQWYVKLSVHPFAHAAAASITQNGITHQLTRHSWGGGVFTMSGTQIFPDPALKIAILDGQGTQHALEIPFLHTGPGNTHRRHLLTNGYGRGLSASATVFSAVALAVILTVTLGTALANKRHSVRTDRGAPIEIALLESAHMCPDEDECLVGAHAI